MGVTITTKYLGPTDTKGSRIKASFGYGKSATISYPYELSGVAVHWKAAKALLEKNGLSGYRFAVGEKQNGYVFVQADAYDDVFKV